MFVIERCALNRKFSLFVLQSINASRQIISIILKEHSSKPVLNERPNPTEPNKLIQ